MKFSKGSVLIGNQRFPVKTVPLAHNAEREELMQQYERTMARRFLAIGLGLFFVTGIFTGCATKNLFWGVAVTAALVGSALVGLAIASQLTEIIPWNPPSSKGDKAE